MSKQRFRKRYFVDAQVQGALLARAARYWVFSVGAVGMLTIIGWVFFAPGVARLVESPELLRSIMWCLVMASSASVLLMPVVLYDAVRFTHRFVGPMVRLRESMRRSAAGESVAPIRFRDDDYWKEFAESFNQMQARIDELERCAEVEPAALATGDSRNWA